MIGERIIVTDPPAAPAPAPAPGDEVNELTLKTESSPDAGICRWETPAEEIGRLCKEITEIGIRAGKDALPKAIRIGELLVEQKAKIPHGGWLPWLEENFPYSESTAQKWDGFVAQA
jgi:hypothetical protein